jgi:hypothetical protein
MKLLVTLEPDETGVIVAEFPSIPRMRIAETNGIGGLENIREAIAGCLDARPANGMPLTITLREVQVLGRALGTARQGAVSYANDFCFSSSDYGFIPGFSSDPRA